MQTTWDDLDGKNINSWLSISQKYRYAIYLSSILHLNSFFYFSFAFNKNRVKKCLFTFFHVATRELFRVSLLHFMVASHFFAHNFKSGVKKKLKNEFNSIRIFLENIPIIIITLFIMWQVFYSIHLRDFFLSTHWSCFLGWCQSV